MGPLLLIGLLGMPAGRMAAEVARAEGQELSKAEAERLVRGDLGARLGIAADTLRVVESDRRTWPDRRLGCTPRRGVEEDPTPVPGYRFVLEAGAGRYTYHTDRAGRLVRCKPPPKRLYPLLR